MRNGRLEYKEKDKKFYLNFSYNTNMMKELSVMQNDIRYSKKENAWIFSFLDKVTIAHLMDFIKRYEVAVDQKTRDVINKIKADSEWFFNFSSAPHYDGDVMECSPKYKMVGNLLPYQEAGVQYAMRARRTFIADPMGLGKTIQALETVNRLRAFPCLVIAKAGLKHNWAKEIGKFYPDATFQVLNNKSELQIPVDYYVINYDILAKDAVKVGNKIKVSVNENLSILRSTVGFKSIIADESHYLKNPKSQRTKAALSLTENVDVILALTGTPLLNRPSEFIAQLQFIGRFMMFGDYMKFVNRYCDMKRTRFGIDTTGSSNAGESNERMRSVCYVRRDKALVLPDLPELVRSIEYVEADNMTEYKRAKSDFLKWYKSIKGIIEKDPKKDGEMQLNVLAKLGQLRQLATRGKIKYVVDWVNEFLESGEKIIIFAHHIFAQEEMEKAFPTFASLIGKTGEQKEKEKHRFMTNQRCKGIICSLMADKEGHTLTEASTVAFLELDWTPANLEQAEARAHRIGQKNTVFSYYFASKDTIDQYFLDMVEGKRDIISLIADGRLEDIL